MEDAIEMKVIEMIVDKLGVNKKDVKLESSFTGDLGADSLDTVEFLLAAETEFDVKIPDTEAEKIKTVGDIINFIRENSK